METLQTKIQKLVELMGFNDFSTNYEPASGRFLIFIDEEDFFKIDLASFISNLDHLIKLMAKKTGEEKAIVIDVNNYHQKREDLILELARAAARKAVATGQEISLPPMNSYERRLVHLELAVRPDIRTESIGEDKTRYVVVKPSQ